MEEPSSKKLVFSKKYSGIPVNKYSGVGNPECVPEEELVYNVVLRQEEIRVTFNKDGMIGFSWSNPCEVQSTANENVAVISFGIVNNIVHPTNEQNIRMIQIDPVGSFFRAEIEAIFYSGGSG